MVISKPLSRSSIQILKTESSKDYNIDMFPYVSIIAPFFNHGDTIKKCLSSLFNQEYPRNRYEVIIVNDGSSDEFLELKKDFPITLISQERRGPANARNKGVIAAKGEILLFIDADCIAPKDWILNHIRGHLKVDEVNSNIGSIGGTVKFYPNEVTFFELCDYYSSWYKPPLVSKTEFEYLPTTNLSIKRKVFLGVGGFNENLMCGEDIDFGVKLRRYGYKSYFKKDIFLYHIGRKTFRDYILHHYWLGIYTPAFRKFGTGVKFNWLFPPNVLIALLFFPIISLGYTIYIIEKWALEGVGVPFYFIPFIFISRIAYAMGVIKGTWLIVKDQR